MNSSLITNLPTPTANDHAANKGYVDTSIPVGGIIMWSGTTGTSLPSNWKLCDGGAHNGITTPDLRGRFILSSGSGSGLTGRTVGNTGGAETVALTEEQMPSHKHGVTASTAGGGEHSHRTSSLVGYDRPTANPYPFDPGYSQLWSAGNPTDGYRFGTGSDYVVNSASSGHNHTITVTETSKGSSTAHENMPPFYVLAFIMRIS